MLSNSEQRRKIGYFRRLLALTDDIYKEMLYERYKVESSKELSHSQANEFKNHLKKKAIELKVFTPKKQYAFQKYKHNNLDNRADMMASPAQLRKIEAMWFGVSRQETDTQRIKALNKFLKRIINVDDIRFVRKTDVQKVIKAIEKMETVKND